MMDEKWIKNITSPSKHNLKINYWGGVYKGWRTSLKILTCNTDSELYVKIFEEKYQEIKELNNDKKD